MLIYTTYTDVPMTIYKLKSNVVVYPGMGGWRFLVIPKKIGKEIKEKFAKRAVGWGSIRVSVTIGKTEWKTSIFPDRKADTYLLPLKKEVRKSESIIDSDKVSYIIKL